MIRAACHCTAVRFEIAKAPTWVLDCNCTLCRRYGVLWSYYHGANNPDLLRVPDQAATSTYLWGDMQIAFNFCKVCGCMTHMAAIDVEPPAIFGVNARMMLGLDPANVRVVQKDNGGTGHFWTRSAEPVMPSSHPPVPPLGPDDWR